MSNHGPIGGIIAELLARHSLDRPDGRPLYAYQARGGELTGIGHALRQIFAGRGLGEPEDQAGLCLYFAERFRVKHESGRWKWETVLVELGGVPNMITLYRAVERGLGWWGRKVVVVDGTRRFLATLACEGGLPLALLAREGTHLRRFFRRLLVELEAFSRSDIEESARQHSHMLPRSLQNEDLYVYAAKLLRAVAEVREALGEVDEPLLELDRRGLRHLIPLRLEDAVARELLEGLLRTERGDAEDVDAIELDFELRPGPVWRVLRVPRFPGRVEVRSFARELQLDTASGAEDLPARMQLMVRSAGGERFPFARAVRVLGGREYQIDAMRGGRAIEGGAALGSYELMAVSGGCERARAPIAGGEEDVGLPWCFADGDDDSPRPLLGVGSLSTTRRSVLVATPRDAAIEGDDVERVSELDAVERTLWRVRGQLRVGVESDVFVVRVDQEKEAQVTYRLSGSARPIGPGGAIVWLGPPRVYEAAEGRRPRPVDGDRLQWRPRGADWGSLDATALGQGDLRVVNDEGTQYRVRVMIAPAELRLSVVPGPGADEGRLEVRGVEGVSITPADVEGCRFAVSKTPDGASLHCQLEREADRPARLRILLDLPGHRRFEITTDFPSPQIAFLDSSGRTYKRRQSVGIDDLLGARARVLTPDHRREFGLFVRGPMGLEELGEFYKLADGLHELAIDEVLPRVRQMFAADSHLDAKLSLRIVPRGVLDPREVVRLEVSRFSRELFPIREDVLDDSSVGALQSIGIRPKAEPTSSPIELRLRPMDDPAGQATVLPWDESSGSWPVNLQSLNQGPWLATAMEGDFLEARPLAMFVPESEASDQGQPPSAAFDPASPRLGPTVRLGIEARRESLPRIVEALAADPGHEDWRLGLDYLSTLSTLPAVTYEFVMALTASADGMAMATIKAIRRDWFPIAWEHLEELQFLWCLVPLNAWKRSCRRFHGFARQEQEQADESIRDALDPKGRIDLLLRSLRKLAEQRLPVMECVADVLAWKWLGNLDPDSLLARGVLPNLRELLVQAKEELHQGMLRRHGHLDATDWPKTHFGSILESVGIDPERDEIPWMRPHLKHRNSVLNAPVVAGAIFALSDGVMPDAESIVKLQALRGFDPEWFDRMQALVAVDIVAEEMRKNSNA